MAMVSISLAMPIVDPWPNLTPRTHPSPYPPPSELLDPISKANGKLYFGTATDNIEWNDTKYDSVLNYPRLWGQYTPANYMKWEYTEPEPGVFNFTGGDQLVSIANHNRALIRCHNLVWHNQIPTWLTNPSTPWTNETLLFALHRHITALVTHWAPSCYAWDIANEVLDDDGTYRESIWYNVTGTSYIPLAFKWAAEAAVAAGHPGIKLYYNDYNIEYAGPKSTAALELVKSLQSQNVKIDGVGLQSHFIVGSSTPSRAAQVSNMETFTALGVDVAVTELDIRFTVKSEGYVTNSTAQEIQAQNYEDTVGACKDVQRCVGVTVWDFTDKYSWIPQTFEGEGAACPWDEEINVKPHVYEGIVKGLQS
ncbi:hypothetical protein UCRPC4_g05402 [Phaeomoniella chlamydospora]|uniref:Beta-xylanase n=1 Tax=Phaeomoniella chlamydospora TaxID=158046 RepID=A0A0G2E4X5_PHACM|nr:hypothetical protein UCRPC4_g05402 [Phaeomoniella chlamydospora]